MMNSMYKKEDFENQNEVRWCPGCGDYAILAAIQRTMPALGLAPHEHVFVSGIGCAGRLPYYMNTYGFHTIHGRATAVATGLKAMRDDLTVWVITGDGDALSIGGNHLIHCLRRNVNVKILLFNNQVYGLTKGQFSPTSVKGQVTKTSPNGVENEPLNPLVMALASGASFVARAVDKDPQGLSEILKAAHAHKGAAFVEIYQDCNIFNNGAFDAFALKTNRQDQTIALRHGAPLCFGQDAQFVLSLREEGFVRGEGMTSQEATVHDETSWQKAMALAKMQYPKLPVALGVYYREERDVYQLSSPIKKSKADLAKLYRAKASWQHGSMPEA